MATPYPFDTQFERFLEAERDGTARLFTIYSQAEQELYAFLTDPPVSLTASEQAFFGALETEVERISQRLAVEGSTWNSQTIPKAFVEGALQHSPTIAFTAIHDRAVRELSGYSLGLITQMDAAMRSIVRQQIAVGMLQGATREQISDRLIRSGLTNIPHWRNLSERAEVIARTETMRAYNMGNLAGIIDTGAVAVRWITGRDERVCLICGPRHGKHFRIEGAVTTDAMATTLDALDPPPAHPRCRCTIRAVYDYGGKVVKPTAPPGGMIDTTPVGPDVPEAVSLSHADAFRALSQGKFDRNVEAFLHSAAFDERQLRLIADAGNDAVRFFTAARYRVTLNLDRAGVGWTPDEAANLLIAMERIHRVLPEYSISDALSTLQIVTKLNALGDMSALTTASGGTMRLNISSLKGRPGTAAGLPGVQETFTHEFGHALAYKLGQRMPAKYMQAPIANQALMPETWTLWQTISRKGVTNSGVWRGDDALVTLRASMARIDEDIARLTKEAARPITSEADFLAGKIDANDTWTERDASIARSLLQLRQTRRRELETQIAKIEKARAKTGVAEHYPTEYAESGQWGEDFADSFRMYVLNPQQLQRSSPVRYSFIEKLLDGRKWE